MIKTWVDPKALVGFVAAPVKHLAPPLMIESHYWTKRLRPVRSSFIVLCRGTRAVFTGKPATAVTALNC